MNDDLAANRLLAPAKELLALEEQLIHKSSDKNQGMANRVGFGLWLLGQVIGLLAALFLVILIATLFPNAPSS